VVNVVSHFKVTRDWDSEHQEGFSTIPADNGGITRLPGRQVVNISSLVLVLLRVRVFVLAH